MHSRDRLRRTQVGGNDGPIIRGGSMEGFRGLLLELGYDPKPILTNAGIEDEVLNQPDMTITTRAYRRALNLAAQATGLHHFGLLLSQRQTFEKLGAVGYLVRHAPNLSISVDRLIRHFRTHDTGSMTRLQADGPVALWMHGLSGVAEDAAIQQTELAIGLACQFMRSALSETWDPVAVYFEHSAPRDLQPYRAVFRCPVHFGQTITAMELKTADLFKPLRQSDPGLFKILEQHVESIEEGLGEDLSSEVRKILQQNLESGLVHLDEIARRIGFKRHILQRRLKAEGTSFQAILDDVRYEMGRRLLRETRTSISEIAGALGYAESGVFTRAFARRSGMSPRDWRRANLSH
ncbi:AraC family transcriptional regulator [Altererythrobacter arenosus]|uniref:AraC family transcriptional regulator n=1 Tax=Altererythrobacter arenosus TaxID=3032592 RepID=A0ABY8FZZ5_9SPHN|nr:AraC family transcriptional regulator [Altererythrobacter sp. CAU 1644]WFL78961.1 AraC family transcriptional regulator [Altererythrobacter sp. CAU 1644]